jgi:pimeloyl-ACP methyl ester carboxylesterase
MVSRTLTVWSSKGEFMATIVHLIHGTWARGFRATAKAEDLPVWTREDSCFRKHLKKNSSIPLECKEFIWSGKNSFDARAAAAIDFKKYLELEIEQRPDEKHIVISHSHGGTVAMHALAALELPAQKCPIEHAIFLSTPFTYLTERKKFAVTNALGCLAAGIVLMFFTDRFPIFEQQYSVAVVNYLILVTIAVLTVILISGPVRGWAQLRPALGMGYIMEREISSRIPVTIFRGSRDEAALAIGLTQSMHAIGEAIIDSGSSKNKRRYTIFVGIFSVLPAFIGISNAYLFLGIAGLSGYYLYCASLGAGIFLTFGRYDIESDLTPPSKRCSVQSFNALDSLAVRHSIYDDEKVLAALMEIINKIEKT